MAIKFNLSDIPADLTLKDATLSIYYKSGTFGIEKSLIYPFTSNWVDTITTWKLKEESVPWEKEGGEYDTTIFSEAPFASEPGWEHFTVTSIVNSWLKRAENNGFIIISDRADGHTGRVYYSSEYSGSITLRPKLTLTFSDDVHVEKPIFSEKEYIVEKNESTISLYVSKENSTLKIYNSLGKMMLSRMLEEQRWNQFDFSKWSKGIYIITIENPKSEYSKSILIK